MWGTVLCRMDEPSATPEQQRMLSNYSRRKKHSFIVSSVIAVFIYFINLLVTGLLLGIFIFVFVETKSYSEDTGCFLYSTDNVPINDLGAICDGSIAVISLLALLEVILVYLGIASIVTGERYSYIMHVCTVVTCPPLPPHFERPVYSDCSCIAVLIL